MKFVRKIIDFYDRIIDGMAVVAAILLIFVTLSVILEVAARNISNHSLGWVEEITSYCLLIIAFLAAPWVLKVDGHVRMDLVINALNPRVRRVFAIVTSAVGMIISAVLTYYAARVTWNFQQNNYFNPTVLSPPKFIFIAFITLGFLFMALESLRITYRYVRQPDVEPGIEAETFAEEPLSQAGEQQ